MVLKISMLSRKFPQNENFSPKFCVLEKNFFGQAKIYGETIVQLPPSRLDIIYR